MSGSVLTADADVLDADVLDADVAACLERAETALDGLLGLEHGGLTDGEVRDEVLALERVRAKLDAATARATRSFDARGVARAEGARSTAAWRRVVGRIEAGRAGRQIRHARALATLPATEAALAAGRVNSDVVTRITAADNDRIDVALRRDEADLIDVAARSTYKEFSDHLGRWIESNDPDGGHRERPDGRRFYCSRTLGGAYALDGWLDPLSGRTFADEHQRIEQILFDADWAEARNRLGRDPRLDELARTPAQRRADALVEMARRSRTCGATDRRPAPLVTILVGSDRFRDTCSLLDGTPLSPGEVAQVLPDAAIARITYDGQERPLSVSRQRTFRGALRRAILVRDGGCTDPLCDEPAWRCEVDHRIPASAGGPTCPCNGQTHCGHHNRTKADTDPRTTGHGAHAASCPLADDTGDPPTDRGP
jgi:hypothetical protein